jgi:hypothetical protein
MKNIQEEELLKSEKNKCSLRTHAAKWPDLESEAKKCITDHRNDGISVSTKMIICEARRWVVTHNINDFAGAGAWCYRFMKIWTKHAYSQRMPAENEAKILEFRKFVIGAREKACFGLSQIGNMDEVPITVDVPSNRTVDNKGAKTVTIKTSGHKKTHHNAELVTCCEDGTKVPPMLIIKMKTMLSDNIPRGIAVHDQER